MEPQDFRHGQTVYFPRRQQMAAYSGKDPNHSVSIEGPVAIVEAIVTDIDKKKDAVQMRLCSSTDALGYKTDYLDLHVEIKPYDETMNLCCESFSDCELKAEKLNREQISNWKRHFAIYELDRNRIDFARTKLSQSSQGFKLHTNAWMPVADPTKMDGAIPACGNIEHICDDGSIRLHVNFADTEHDGRIPYKGEAIVNPDLLRMKKSEILKYIKGAYESTDRVETVTVDGYDLDGERERYFEASVADLSALDNDLKQ